MGLGELTPVIPSIQRGQGRKEDCSEFKVSLGQSKKLLEKKKKKEQTKPIDEIITWHNLYRGWVISTKVTHAPYFSSPQLYF